MTLMIPSTIVRLNTPRGEKRIFNLLQNAPGTENWIALHSFDIAKHESKTSGEVDMILIIPEAGVLFIEVKGVGVKRDGGTWFYDDGRKPDAGPFVQASTAMHSVRKTLAKSFPDSSSLLFFSAVIFPEFDFNIPSSPLEWHDWQVIDKKKLNSSNVASLFRGVVEKSHQHMLSIGKSWYDPVKSRPSVTQSEKLANFLRPNFSFHQSDRSLIDFINESIESHTVEQLIALDSLDDNDRTLVTGPAGTGKTVIAVEAFRRSVKAGEKVLFLCFNRFLGLKLQRDLSKFIEEQGASDRAFVSTFHSYLMKLADKEIDAPVEDDYWTRYLPDQAMEAVLEDKVSNSTLISPTMLIIDEAQDLMLPQYLDCIEAILGVGLDEAKWLLLGDFKNQAIFRGDIKFLEERCSSSFAKYTLRRNCRNSGQVAKQVKLVFDVQPEYRTTMPDFDGAEATVRCWSRPSDQSHFLSTVLEEYTKKFLPNELIVLSPDKSSVALNNLDGYWKGKLSPYNPLVSNKGNVCFSTISAFKGLESPVVIITDIDDLSPVALTSLYVAISRAKLCVTILMHERCKKRWAELLKEGLNR